MDKSLVREKITIKPHTAYGASLPARLGEDVPADFVCPVCGLDKDAFEVEK